MRSPLTIPLNENAPAGMNGEGAEICVRMERTTTNDSLSHPRIYYKR